MAKEPPRAAAPKYDEPKHDPRKEPSVQTHTPTVEQKRVYDMLTQLEAGYRAACVHCNGIVGFCDKAPGPECPAHQARDILSKSKEIR